MAVDPRISLAVPKLGINATPTVNNESNQILVRNTETGAVDYVNKNDITGGDQDLQSVLEKGSEASISTPLNIQASGGFGIIGGSYGSISTTEPAGIVISGNAGGVQINGSSLGVQISGSSGGVDVSGGQNGINLDGQGGSVDINGGGSGNDINAQGNLNIFSPGQANGIWTLKELSGVFFLYYNGVPKFSIDADGKLTIANNDSFVGTFDPVDITENKIYKLPNQEGTLALQEFTVPLTGTEVENPITGSIEFEDSDVSGEKGIKGSFFNSNYSIVFSEEGSIKIRTENSDSTQFTELAVSNTQVSVVSQAGGVFGTSPTRGIMGGNDFSSNAQIFDYVQKIYVDRYTTKRLYSTSLAGASTTGTETISYAVPIKASDLGEGILSFEGIVSKTGTAGNGIVRVYRSDSATSLSGALRLMTFISATTLRTALIQRENILLRNGSSQSLIYSTTVSASNEVPSANPLENIDYDFSTDHFLLFTTSSTSGDTVRFDSVKVTFNKN